MFNMATLEFSSAFYILAVTVGYFLDWLWLVGRLQVIMIRLLVIKLFSLALSSYGVGWDSSWGRFWLVGRLQVFMFRHWVQLVAIMVVSMWA